jgi:hypothetical protein
MTRVHLMYWMAAGDACQVSGYSRQYHFVPEKQSTGDTG